VITYLCIHIVSNMIFISDNKDEHKYTLKVKKFKVSNY